MIAEDTPEKYPPGFSGDENKNIVSYIQSIPPRKPMLSAGVLYKHTSTDNPT